MSKVEYPKCLYKKDGSTVIVADAEELKLLKGEFKESPADWANQKEVKPEEVVSVEKMKEALLAAGFKEAKLEKKSDEEIQKLFEALKAKE